MCNLASPVVAGFIFEILAGKASGGFQTYGKVFSLFATLYIIEPIMTWVYITNVCTLSEKVHPFQVFPLWWIFTAMPPWPRKRAPPNN